jgi:enolase
VCELPLSRYLGGANAALLPVPCLKVIDGGRQTPNTVEFQKHDRATSCDFVRGGDPYGMETSTRSSTCCVANSILIKLNRIGTVSEIERIAKFNQLIRTERQPGASARFALKKTFSVD